MIRLNYFLRRLPNLSLEAFHEYWRETHAVIVDKKITVPPLPKPVG